MCNLQERDSRIEVKKRDRNSIGFAFGSSTPRLLDVPADYGLVSPSAFWGQRRWDLNIKYDPVATSTELKPHIIVLAIHGYINYYFRRDFICAFVLHLSN